MLSMTRGSRQQSRNTVLSRLPEQKRLDGPGRMRGLCFESNAWYPHFDGSDDIVWVCDPDERLSLVVALRREPPSAHAVADREDVRIRCLWIGVYDDAVIILCGGAPGRHRVYFGDELLF